MFWLESAVLLLVVLALLFVPGYLILGLTERRRVEPSSAPRPRPWEQKHPGCGGPLVLPAGDPDEPTHRLPRQTTLTRVRAVPSPRIRINQRWPD